MKKIEADLKQLQIREIMQGVTYETLELIFIESKRELDKRFFENMAVTK